MKTVTAWIAWMRMIPIVEKVIEFNSCCHCVFLLDRACHKFFAFCQIGVMCLTSLQMLFSATTT